MKKTIISIMISILVIILAPTAVFARSCTQYELKNGCVDTIILGNGCSCDNGKGSGVADILYLVVDIMTIGIGILGLIGILIVGTQYLTAGGKEEQVKKAKHRMFEIIIGLVAYVILYAAFRWLIPNFDAHPIESNADSPQQIVKPGSNSNSGGMTEEEQ